MKLHFKRENFTFKNRAHVIDVLKPFILAKDMDDQERMAKYGLSVSDFQFVEDINDADIAILPFSWNYYMKSDSLFKAQEYIEQCANARKKVISWMEGDFGVKIPYYPNVLVLRQSGYRQKLPGTHLGMPVFIRDPLKEYYKTSQITISQYTQVPLVGFCGQSQGSPFKYTKDIIRTSGRNLLYHLNLSDDEPQSIYPSTLRRSKALKFLSTHAYIKCKFIRRRKYRAGANNKIERFNTAKEFYDNIEGTQYTLCVRGGGNFSVRFYETLAMGKIPVYVNTDGLLPFSEKIDWKKHVVWVESSELENIGDCIIDFHEKLGEDGLKYIQYENRKLWENNFQLGNFYLQLLQSITSD
jgi:hypothetical protein